MLRRKSPPDENQPKDPKGFVPYPKCSEPFLQGYAPVGIHFYTPAEAFYLPYAGLQTMRLHAESLQLVFTTDDVLVEGRGLHSVYAQIADQKLRRLHEQGERYEGASESPIFVRKIGRVPREGAGVNREGREGGV